jgi:hypothetical protein
VKLGFVLAGAVDFTAFDSAAMAAPPLGLRDAELIKEP